MSDRLFDPGPKVPPAPTFHARVTITQPVRFDLKRFFENRLDDYINYPLNRGYEWWEKPRNYLWQWLNDHTDGLMFWTPEGEVVEDFHGDFDVDFDSLTKEDVLALHALLGLNPEGTALA